MLAADDARSTSTRDPCWADEFFGEEHVVSTFQHLLHDSPKNVEDLSRLCIAAREDSVVLAFNILAFNIYNRTTSSWPSISWPSIYINVLLYILKARILKARTNDGKDEINCPSHRSCPLRH